MTLKMEIILILHNRILPFPNETNWEIPSRLNVSILIKKFKRRLIYEIFSFIDLKRECQKIIPITDKVSDVFSQRISSFGWTSQMIWWVIRLIIPSPIFHRPSCFPELEIENISSQSSWDFAMSVLSSERQEVYLHIKKERFNRFRLIILVNLLSWIESFESDKRLDWVNHSPVGDKWVMTHDRPTRTIQIQNK